MGKGGFGTATRAALQVNKKIKRRRNEKLNTIIVLIDDLERLLYAISKTKPEVEALRNKLFLCNAL